MFVGLFSMSRTQKVVSWVMWMTKWVRLVRRFQMIQNYAVDTMLSDFLKADSFCKHYHVMCFFDLQSFTGVCYILGFLSLRHWSSCRRLYVLLTSVCASIRAFDFSRLGDISSICWWIFATLCHWTKMKWLGFGVKRSVVKVTLLRWRHPALDARDVKQLSNIRLSI